jgi:hypothetical protein
MYALRRLATVTARRSTNPTVTQTASQYQLMSPNNHVAPAAARSSSLLFPSQKQQSFSNLAMDMPVNYSSSAVPAALTTLNNQRPPSSIWQNLWNNLLEETATMIWQMSSTLKKRRSKMNKHKLRKRRKKNRMKNKK